jgi:hypothetical protein
MSQEMRKAKAISVGSPTFLKEGKLGTDHSSLQPHSTPTYLSALENLRVRHPPPEPSAGSVSRVPAGMGLAMHKYSRTRNISTLSLFLLLLVCGKAENSEISRLASRMVWASKIAQGPLREGGNAVSERGVVDLVNQDPDERVSLAAGIRLKLSRPG